MIVFPNAKINIGLRVTERRNDGFHNIETIMVPVGLADALELTPASDGVFGFSSSGIPIDGPEESNLCVRAFRLMQKQHNLPEIKIHLHKIIPTGAGLGGGSSDAAFTLKLLNRMFSLKLCNTELVEMASELGSDCPFFIFNNPSVASGRGELLSPVNYRLNGFSILLVKPEVAVTTAWAYSQVKPSGMHIPDATDILHDPALWRDLLVNDFEEPVFRQWPEISAIKKQLLELGAVYAAMSGSGSAVYGIFKQLPDYQKHFQDKFVWSGKAC
ncbi:MAG: 4-(cytidine 5'-diphospho)-2-C-methyl-D-erythritol kinase [Lentimicrobium sp.]|nr:4-(cytidine 5'-diphospho)-2-C-methyl-D-erythritol kinase [Lentimicrobium sp.]